MGAAWGLGMLLTLAIFLSISAANAAPASAWEAPMQLNGVWKFRSGDSAQWAGPGYADAHWDSAVLMESRKRELFPRQGIGWFRIAVTLPERPRREDAGMAGTTEIPAATAKLAIRHIPALPQEFYWDGVLIGRNGKVAADLEGERIGEGFLKDIPDRLTGPGRHVLAVRMSAHHSWLYPCPAFMVIGDPALMELLVMREGMVMLFLAGIFMFGAIYRYFNYRAAGYGRNTFFFSIFVLACAGYIVLQYIGYIVTMSDTMHLVSRLALGAAWYFMISMIPDLFVFAETFPYRWIGKVQLIAGVFFAVPMTMLFVGWLPFQYGFAVELANQLFCYLSIGLSIWVIVWAVWRRQTGSRPALLGILSLLAGVTLTFAFDSAFGWAAGVAAHVIFLAQAQSLQLSERNRIHSESKIRSARLEIELLKKNIQPHFLLNSLNSIIAWLEEEPKTAVRLVNALADELEMLLKVSAEQTIPVEEEIRLCRTHLQVMGLRQDKSYRLDSQGIRGEEPIPPLVLHTLVENGLTHGYAGKTEGNFLLKREDIPGGVRFSLFNDGVPKERREKKEEGTGLRYVRSRLEEAFPGRWSLDSRAVAGGWQVLVDLKL